MFNMAVPVTECGKEEKLSVIRFYGSQYVKYKEVCGRMAIQKSLRMKDLE
jgi:hypothetical protein